MARVSPCPLLSLYEVRRGAIVPVVHMSATPCRAGPKGAGQGVEASDCGPTGATRPPPRSGKKTIARRAIH